MQAYLSLFDCRFAGLRGGLHGELFYPITNDGQIFDLLLNVSHLQSSRYLWEITLMSNASHRVIVEPFQIKKIGHVLFESYICRLKLLDLHNLGFKFTF